jgi:hypothetical protein
MPCHHGARRTAPERRGPHPRGVGVWVPGHEEHPRQHPFPAAVPHAPVHRPRRHAGVDGLSQGDQAVMAYQEGSEARLG